MPTFPLIPTAPFPTANAGAARALGAQLDLFATAETAGLPEPRGLSAAVARASISPGWWSLVQPLYVDEQILILACEEVDGALVLEAMLRETPETPESPGTDAVTQTAPGEWLASLLRHLRELAAQTCGCCGARGAAPDRPTFAGPTRVVCPPCRARLRAGEAFLAVADTYWHLDGAPRARASAVAAVSPALPATSASSSTPTRHPCATLPPEELRALFTEIHRAMAAEVVGSDDLVGRLSLLATLHVGGGLPRGPRALVLGPSGTGKSHGLDVMVRAIQAYDVPVVRVDCLDLTTPGYSGAATVPQLLARAFGDTPLDAAGPRHALVVLDELHHAVPRADYSGNLAGHAQQLLGSLLGLAGGGTVALEDGRSWSSREAMVVGVGAFTDTLDLRRNPTIDDLVRRGHLPLELATRLAEDVIVVRPIPEPALRDVLRRWPALTALTAVCERLGYRVRVHPEAIARAARVVTRGAQGATARTAGGWLVAALRQGLLTALADPSVRALDITPDALPIAVAPTRDGPDEPPDAPGRWDATVVRPPR